MMALRDPENGELFKKKIHLTPMRERAFAEAICRRLPKAIHHQSMNYAAAFANGTPDRWFEGEIRDLWVEWKVLRSMPRSGVVVGDYSKKQLAWMTRRWNRHGRLGIVGIVGLPNRTAVIQRRPNEWVDGTDVAEALTFKEIADWIIDYCGD